MQITPTPPEPTEGAYWYKREQELAAQLEKDEAKLKKRISRYYAQEQKRLEGEIARYYSKYGVDGVIEYRKLLLSLSDTEREMLFADEAAFAKKYPQYAHLIPLRNSAYKINRLEAMQEEVTLSQYKLGAITEEEFTAHLEKLSGRCYDSVAKMTGPVGTERAEIIKNVVGTDWTGDGDYKASVWGNTEKISKKVNKSLAQHFARGDTYDKIAKTLADEFGVSQRNAMRLVYTEGTYVMNETTARTFEQDFEYCRLIDMEDSKVCEICNGIEAKQRNNPIKFSERQAGINFPPIHPWCRCQYQVVVPDRQKWIDDYVSKHGGDPELSEDQKKAAERVLKKLGYGT